MSSSCCTSKRTLSYRLTGLQSIERIDPILKSSDEFDWISINHSADALDFVWETSCKVVQRSQHVEARILNKLHNSIIIEDKSNLAFLQLNLRDSSSSGFLKTYVAENAKEVSRWASNRWTLSTTSMKDRTRILAGELESGSNVKALKSTRSQQQNTLSDDRCNDSDWWVVKASKGNGGRDIWILNKDNAEAVLSDLPTTDEYVIQKYITDPMLWNGFKFHFRMYTILKADMSTYLYCKAFILTAGLKYDSCSDDIQKQITNLSLNKRIQGHPGQIPINMREAYPKVFSDASRLWSDIVTSAAPFLLNQRDQNHFEFFGLDIICDQSGHCWLIEVNRLPGLESSNLNKSAEDEMYNEMMSSLIQMVTQPLQFSTPMNSSENELSAVEKVKEGMSIGEESSAFEFENNYIINEANGENGNKFDQSFNQRGAVTERNLQSNNSTCRVGKKMEEEEKDKMNNYAHIMERERQQWGLWNLVRGPTEGPLQVQYGMKDLWKNIFNWRAYTFKNRNIIVVHENMDL